MSQEITEKICPIEQWLDEPYYVGSVATSLRPYWKKKIIEYFNGDKREFIFTGSQRLGKSYCACVIIMRYIYEIYFVPDFPTKFGLDPTTLPKIIFFSFSKAKADSTGIDRLIRLIDRAPWFRTGGRRRRDVQSYVEFPWVQVFSGVNESHATGEDLLGAILDEANVRHTAKDNQFAETQRLFTETIARSYTTFSWHGVWKGFSGLISTTGSQSSFVDQKLKDALEKHDKFVVQGAIYEFAPEKFSDKKFKLCIGAGEVAPFILGEEPVDLANQIAQATGLTVAQYLMQYEDLVIEIPVDLKRFYQDDINYALANLSGVTRVETSNFFRRKRDLEGMFDMSLPRLCYPWMPNLGLYDDFDVEEYFSSDGFQAVLDFYQGENCYSHWDISNKNDRTGGAVVYRSLRDKKMHTLWWGNLYYERVTPDNEIDQKKVLSIMRYLISIGVRFGRVTADQYASLYFLQQLKLLIGKDKVDRQSVDEDATQYLELLNLARQDQIRFHYEPLAKFYFSQLIYDKFANKVDHPHNTDPVGKGVTVDGVFYDGPLYGKDICDAAAGATHLCIVYERVEEDFESVSAVKAEDDDFYSGALSDEDDFYSGISTQELDEEESVQADIDKFEKSLLGEYLPGGIDEFRQDR